MTELVKTSRKRWLLLTGSIAALALLAIVLLLTTGRVRDKRTAEQVGETLANEAQLEAVSGTESPPGQSDPSPVAPPAEKEKTARNRAGSTEPADPPHAKQSKIERISWKDAIEWWPYRPLFQATSLPRQKPGWQEAIFATSDSGGMEGSAKDSGALTVIYEYPPHDAESENYFGILEGGGFILIAQYYPPGTVPAFTTGIYSRKARPITVRGHAARVIDHRKDQGSDVNWRDIRWEQLVKEGQIQWSIGNDITLYSEEESIDFINRLAEV